MSASEHLNPRLFELPDRPEKVDVSKWADEQPVWHSSYSRTMPQENPDRPATSPGGFGSTVGFHAGTAWSAVVRNEETGGSRYYHPLALGGEDAEMFTDISDHDANYNSRVTEIVQSGRNITYNNDNEDVGSLSVRAPRQNLRTWAEHVVQNPGEHTYAERRAVRRGHDVVYGESPALPSNTTKSVPDLTAIPIKVHPSSIDERENRVDNFHPDPSSEEAIWAKYKVIEIPDITEKTLYPAFTRRSKEQRPAHGAIPLKLPGM